MTKQMMVFLFFLTATLFARAQDDRVRGSSSPITNMDIPGTQNWHLQSNQNEVKYLPLEDMGSIQIQIQDLGDEPCPEMAGDAKCQNLRISMAWINHLHNQSTPLICNANVGLGLGFRNLSVSAGPINTNAGPQELSKEQTIKNLVNGNSPRLKITSVSYGVGCSPEHYDGCHHKLIPDDPSGCKAPVANKPKVLPKKAVAKPPAS